MKMAKGTTGTLFIYLKTDSSFPTDATYVYSLQPRESSGTFFYLYISPARKAVWMDFVSPSIYLNGGSDTESVIQAWNTGITVAVGTNEFEAEIDGFDAALKSTDIVSDPEIFDFEGLYGSTGLVQDMTVATPVLTMKMPVYGA